MNPASVPDFDDLPKVEGQPQGCAWGVFDKDGQKDHYGTLNFLTPEIVTAAAKEVKDGVSISLNWPLNGIKFPFPHRKAPVHKVIPLDPGATGYGFDDEIEINTQFSSQWDSLCHFTGPSGVTYNGHKPTKEGLEAAAFTHENAFPTIDHWHSRGGVVGRGVLIDYKRYAEEVKGEQYHPSDGYRITVEDVEAAAKWQGVEFRLGDVVLIRTGYTEMLEAPTPEDFAKFSRGTLSGLHGSLETARWAWNRRFAAMASDSHAFEAFPPVDEGTGEVVGVDGLVLHKWFLNYFGLPIGELWDLKALGEYAKKTGRYSFLLTSSPLNHPGLVASPPNAIAIF
ncbi:putative cyclase-domain-containing protein [Cladorrhinum sp. PSN332]|nr:putative cyclase-domain-containing protein [Cladorrhinum sp. PSN332]